MPTDYDDEVEEESGSSLRRKLEETISENRQLTAELSTLKAQEVISENGYGLVKVEDLLGVNLGEMTDKAGELQQERTNQQVDLARDMLAKKGYTGTELDQAVEDFLAPVASEGNQDVAAHQRTRTVSAIGGNATPVNDNSGLMGLDAIDAALRGKQ